MVLNGGRYLTLCVCCRSRHIQPALRGGPPPVPAASRRVLGPAGQAAHPLGQAVRQSVG